MANQLWPSAKGPMPGTVFSVVKGRAYSIVVSMVTPVIPKSTRSIFVSAGGDNSNIITLSYDQSATLAHTRVAASSSVEITINSDRSHCEERVIYI